MRFLTLFIILISHVLIMNDTDGEDFIEVPSSKRRFCPHCLEAVSYSTYYRHRDRFFDVATNQWNRAPTNLTVSTSTSTTTQVEEDASVREFGEGTVWNKLYSQGTSEGVSPL